MKRRDEHSSEEDRWRGLRASAREHLEMREYAVRDPAARLASSGIDAEEVISDRGTFADAWIPGVEVFSRRVYQQRGRGYFAELARVTEGVLDRIGLVPQQWSTALMHRDSAKGFHIHPPHVPDTSSPEQWFQELYGDSQGDYSRRPYDLEQWDIMFFLTGLCEMVLVDERAGLPRRVMRFMIPGDSRPGPGNAGVVIPAGVGHALRNVGNEDLIMVYGTSTTFDPDCEGRIASDIEQAPLALGWERYLAEGDST